MYFQNEESDLQVASSRLAVRVHIVLLQTHRQRVCGARDVKYILQDTAHLQNPSGENTHSAVLLGIVPLPNKPPRCVYSQLLN